MDLESCIAFILRRRWLTILLSVLVIAALAAGAPQIGVDVDYRNYFDKKDPHLVALERLEDTYAVADSAFVAVAPKNGTVFTRKTLAVIEQLTEQLWRTPYVTRVDSLSNYSHSEGHEDELVVETLVEDADALSDDDIKRIGTIALGAREIESRLISPDGRVAGLGISLSLPEDRSQGILEVTDFLRSVVAEVRAKNPDVQVYLTGEVALNRAIRDAIDDEMSILGPIAIAIMLIVAVLVLRSIWGTVAILLMMGVVVQSSVGFAGWANMKLVGESGPALFAIMAVTVAHSVHIIEAMLAGLSRGMDRKQAAVHTLQFNMWPVFLTSITTAIGFLSLNFSETPPFRVMGNVVAFGVLCAFVFSVTLLPAFMSILPLRPRRVRADRPPFFDRFGQFIVSYRVSLLWAFGVLVVALVVGIPRIELKENWQEILDERYEFRRSTEFVTKNLTGMEAVEYSLSSGRVDGITDVKYLGRVDAFAEWLRKQPHVVHVEAITDVLKRLNKNMHGDDPEFYRVPDNPDLAAQYLLLYEFSLPVGRDLNNRIDVKRTSTRATVVLNTATSRQLIELDRRAQAWLRRNAPGMETEGTGVSVVSANATQRSIESMLIGTGTAMAIVSLILIFVFKSVRLGLISLIPNFVPAAMAMGLWGYAVGYIGVAAAIVTSIAFGIVVDDTIHFMTNYIKGRKRGLMPPESVRAAFRSVGPALLATTAVFALGFMVYGASGISSNQSLGLLVGITVIIALLADFLFLPPLLMALDRTEDGEPPGRSGESQGAEPAEQSSTGG